MKVEVLRQNIVGDVLMYRVEYHDGTYAWFYQGSDIEIDEGEKRNLLEAEYQAILLEFGV